jgi:hypothetical protein
MSTYTKYYEQANANQRKPTKRFDDLPCSRPFFIESPTNSDLCIKNPRRCRNKKPVMYMLVDMRFTDLGGEARLLHFGLCDKCARKAMWHYITNYGDEFYLYTYDHIVSYTQEEVLPDMKKCLSKPLWPTREALAKTTQP